MVTGMSVTAEGLHTAADLFDSVVAFVLVAVAARPADREHPYGHGKYETLAALAVVSFLPLYQQTVQGASATNSGVLLLPMMITLAPTCVKHCAIPNPKPLPPPVMRTISSDKSNAWLNDRCIIKFLLSVNTPSP